MGFLYGNPKDFCTFSALISCTLSFLVILTCIIFPRMRSKMFMRVIFYISITSFIANATVFSGTPDSYFLCYFQGLLQQFFYPASWLWNTVLTYLLFSLVVHKKIDLPWWKMHLICWSIPFIITFLPLTTEYYGVQPEDDDWCWLQPSLNGFRGRVMNQFWRLMTFNILIFGCFAIMTYFGLVIYWDIYVKKAPHTEQVLSVLNILMYYPISLFIAWFPNAFLDAFGDANLPQNGGVMIFINSLSLWQGGFIAIIFFIKSREARHHWYVLFHYLFGGICPFSIHNEGGIIHGAQEDRDSELDTDAESSLPSSGTKNILKAPTSSSFASRDSSFAAQSKHIVSDFEEDEVYRGTVSGSISSHSAASQDDLRTSSFFARWYNSEHFMARGSVDKGLRESSHISMSNVTTAKSASSNVMVNNPLNTLRSAAQKISTAKSSTNDNNTSSINNPTENETVSELKHSRQSAVSEAALDGIVDI